MDIKNIQLDQLEVGTSRYNSICFRDIKRVSFILKALEGFLTTYLQILIIFHPSEINIHEEICNKEAAEKSITYIQRDLIVKRRWYTEQSDLLWDPVIVRANPHVIHADQVLHMVYVI